MAASFSFVCIVWVTEGRRSFLDDISCMMWCLSLLGLARTLSSDLPYGCLHIQNDSNPLLVCMAFTTWSLVIVKFS